ncbi:hypothetical protein DLJ46_13920 [Micromonospora globispora]|uniref:Uncharacterized protein n=1 Tax=Micromonospora globispora TaxID=1450148 RepID=A0A317K784_9ACTN|nr:hypothetical protein [Micromonospora globispora]PWU47712.1 hypothetical protein DLJ46_13920 [Micromonospora globispora]
MLRDADPADKAKVYRQLGLRLTFHAETQTVHAEADLSAHRGPMGRVPGGTRTIAPALMTIGKTLKLTQLWLFGDLFRSAEEVTEQEALIRALQVVDSPPTCAAWIP